MGHGSTGISHRRANFEPEGPFCSWFSAAIVILCRTEMLWELGGFDENIFIYQDDLDLSLRITEAGYSMIYLLDTAAKRLNSQSAPPSVRLHWRKDWNFSWSRLYLMKKHKGVSESKRHAWNIIYDHGPKSLFYALVLDRKKFIRDFAAILRAFCIVLGTKPKRPA